MPRRTADAAAPPTGGDPPEADAEEGAEEERSSSAAAISPPPPVAASASTADVSPGAPSAGVENHPKKNAAAGPSAHLARPDDKNGPYHERQRFSQRLRRKLASAPKPQPRASTGSSSSGDDVGEARPTGDDVEAGRPTPVTPAVRPPPPSMLRGNSPTHKPSIPAFHEVHARLVEDESERPVYDAVPVEEEHWAKRHQRKIVGGLVLVIAAMAVVLGVFFGASRGGSDVVNAATVYGSQCFADREELKAAVDEYIAGGDTCVRGGSKCEVIQTYGWPIGSWCTSNVTEMSGLFAWTENFNDDLSSWDTSKVTDMSYMFSRANTFNGDVSNFDTSNVTSMEGMFAEASSFNGDVSNWDTSKVTSMARMFLEATAFNQSLCAWGVHHSTGMYYSDMFSGTNCTNQNDPTGPDTNWCSATCDSAE